MRLTNTCEHKTKRVISDQKQSRTKNFKSRPELGATIPESLGNRLGPSALSNVYGKPKTRLRSTASMRLKSPDPGHTRPTSYEDTWSDITVVSL